MAGPGTQAFWIDAAHHGTQEHYGEQLRKWRHAFAAAEGEPSAGGITLDPLHFALGAWEVAGRPVADSPYVRHHPRVLDATCHRPEEAEGLLAVVELAVPAPVRLPDGWAGWQRQDGDGGDAGTYTAPPYERPTALSTLELRVPLPADHLPTPTKARATGLPNLDDAQAALDVLVAELNAVVTPFLRELDGAGDETRAGAEPEAGAGAESGATAESEAREGAGDAEPLLQWLRTQIEADKATAETAGGGAWRYVPAGEGNRLEFDGQRAVTEIGFHADDLLHPVEAIHIALHDPADVAARCEAKLSLLTWHDRHCPSCTGGAPCPTLRHLASGYRLRPGWHGEWGGEAR